MAREAYMGMDVRKAAVAGRFYPGKAGDLRKAVESFTRKAAGRAQVDAKAVLVPHAGYVYSGAAAGEVFASVRLPQRIAILCPNHTGDGAPLALAPAGAWETPLGLAEVDAEMNAALLKECPHLKEDAAAHRRDHAIEVQLPFLQVLRPGFRFSAICVRSVDYGALEALGHALARVAAASRAKAGVDVLPVISSDMTHYVTAGVAERQDRMALAHVEALDPRGLYRTVVGNDITMCGFAPAVAVLVACRDLGATKGETVCYTNSGAASGDFSDVVAYAGVVIR